jgi:tRNA threonylcarbamoyladenosine modification (KEOPS) complex  Pcc1 subunit
MQEDAVVKDEAIFEDVSKTIYSALLDVKSIGNQKTGITFKAYTNALKLLI